MLSSRMRRIASFVVSLASAFATTTALAAAGPFLIHDCGNIHPRPRPCDGAANVTRYTSIYFEVVVTLAGHLPNDGVDPNSIVATIKKGAGTPITMFGPNQIWAPGYSGKMTAQFTDSGNWGFGVYTVSAAPLDPQATYLVTVTAQTMTRHSPINPATNTVSFTTRRDLAGAAQTSVVDLAAPTVTWPDHWFAGECKPDFDTSRSFDQEPAYVLIDQARARIPDFMLEQRDFPWMGEYWQANFFDGDPNVVRERETRRILQFTDLTSATDLTLTDLAEGPLYGIPANRPLSQDFHVDDMVLVCDASKSEVRKVLAVDDAGKKVRVEKLAIPASQWTPGDPAGSPADDPTTPDNFTYPLAALRKRSPSGTPVYYWRRLDDELDQHVAHGRRPQVNPFSSPVDLCATGVTENTAGGVCENEPKNYAEWDGFIRTLVGHLIDRYGAQTLDWTYSIGNEPDLSAFWKDSNKFFKYYDYTSNAILRAFEEHGLDASRVKIGGVEIGIFYGKINDMLYHCSPSAANPTPGFEERNSVCMDATFDGKRAARVQDFCTNHGGKGCPLDYVSMHTYQPAADAASTIDGARNASLSIDAAFYAALRVHSHETTPDWVGSRDPGWKEVYGWGGFFPSWGGDYFRRILDFAMADSRKAGGKATLLAWPFNYNFDGEASIAGFMRVDDNGDGNQDRVEAVADSFFRFAELAGWMSSTVASLPTLFDAGDSVSGWRSVEPGADRFLMYAHDPLDIEARETGGWNVTLQLSHGRFPSVAVTEYRIDRDHGARTALAALPDRGSNGLYTSSELSTLISSSTLVPIAPAACRTVAGGALSLSTRVLSQGISYLDVVKALVPSEVAGLAFAADKTTLSWTSAASDAGPDTAHDVVRGALGQFPVGSQPAETCLASAIPGAAIVDAALPDLGTGFWYLVRGRNACGIGTWGSASDGAPRSSSACP